MTAACAFHLSHVRSGSSVYGQILDSDTWEECRRTPPARTVPVTVPRKPRAVVKQVEPERDPFMSVKEIADRLAVSKMTTYRLIASGRLRAVQVGRSYRVRQSAFAEYLQSAEVEGAS